MPDGAATRGPPVSPGRGPMAPGWAVLVMLVLSTLRVCGTVSLPALGQQQQQGGQWVWGAAGPAQAEPPPLSRRKRDDGGSSTGTPTLGHGHAATVVPGSKETDSPEPDLLLGSVPPPAPGTNASLHGALVVATTARPLDETDVPDLPLSSSSLAAPSINASLLGAFPVPTTADPLDETDSPDPDLLQGSVPPPAPSTEAAPQKSITTIPSWLTSPSEEETVAGGTDSTSSALGPTTTGYKKGRDPPTATHSTAWDMKPWGTAVPVPWDPSRMMGKCLLAILLLALVAATFMVCTGVLGTLLWRRGRMAHHRLAPTEMVCISSLLPDGETVANGPKPIPLRRQKLLLDGGSEADGDNLTLSSFLPEHS